MHPRRAKQQILGLRELLYERGVISTACLKSSSVDEKALSACVKDSSRGLTYAQKDFDQANKFNISGSPTLTLNNKIASEFDFATNTTNGRSPEALKSYYVAVSKISHLSAPHSSTRPRL